MVYVDGYVLPVKKKNLKSYKKMAAAAGKVWIKHGALSYVECVADDLKTVTQWKGLTFSKMAKTKPGETVIFAYVTYRSKKHRDSVNKKVTAEFVKDRDKHIHVKMPFDMNKMAYAGFDPIVRLTR